MTRTAEDTSEEAFSRALRAALGILRSHPSVVEVSEPTTNEFGSVIVDFKIRIEMPNAWMAQGQSANGVRTVEPVTLKFWDDYPLSAPLPLLRDDFDRSLAHVQPGAPSSRPVPCLYEGRLSELLQQRGFSALLDQFVTWLTNAALGTLIDPSQGWEPVRRDSIRDTIIADSCLLRERVTRHGGHTSFDLTCLRVPFQGGEFFHVEAGRDEVRLHSNSIGRIFKYRDLSDGAVQEKGLVLFVWPGKDGAGRPFVSDRYFPETVTDVASLKARADA